MFKSNRLFRTAALGVTTLAIGLSASSAAEARYFLDKSEAQYYAKTYVDDEFRNTNWLNLSARCRPRGCPARPRATSTTPGCAAGTTTATTRPAAS